MVKIQELLFQTSLFLLLFQLSSPIPYTPPDKYFINCGSDSNATLNGRTFVADSNSGTFAISPGRSYPAGDPNSEANATSSLYGTARIFSSASSYELHIAEDEHGTYLVRLHFLPLSSLPELSGAQFNVSASGFSLLSGFAVPKGTKAPVIKEFILKIEAPKLGLHFSPLKSSLAFVNAIEIFRAPESYLPDNATHVTATGITKPYTDLLSQGLHPIYRLNVGGPALMPGDDSLWRNWVPDDGFLVTRDRAMNSSYFSGSLSYEPGASTGYTASHLVYRTAKQSNRSSYVDANAFNITWQFNVSKNTAHFVRVHVCDIINPSVADTNLFNLYIYRRFNQGINTYPRFFKPVVPFYFDFVVDSDDSGLMSLSIGPVERTSKATAFLNGLEIMKIYVPTLGSQRNNIPTIVGSVVGGVILICIVLVVLILHLKWGKANSLYYGGWSFVGVSSKKTSNASRLPSSCLELRMPLSVISRATNKFDQQLIIGSGGFGNVYKGTLASGEVVAVKRHKAGNNQGLEEFEREIIILSLISHRHLVSLKGYCNDKSEMILVYEYMENGTLKDALYDSNGDPKCTLPWKLRLQICLASARGLDYLHTDSDRRIIHCDVKSANILLDKNFRAKVSDFGISRLGPVDQSSESLITMCTPGYLDPEYMNNMQLTEKFDVYSFGVVLLEVLCARPPIKDQVRLADWVKSMREAGQLEESLDPFLVGKIKTNSMEKFVETAEKCLDANNAKRPKMSDVVYDLEYILDLEGTLVDREPHEDSTIDFITKLPLPMLNHLASVDFSCSQDFGNPVNNDGSDIAASKVFSQLKIDIPS